ncbi:MAG: hypothetical protein WCD66_01540 [Rhodanobacteraceae bacterium]
MSERSRHVFSSLVMLLTAVLSGLALGAVWSLLSGLGMAHAAWLSVGAGMAMAASMRFSSPQASWFAAGLAGLGTLLAAFYAECLQLLARIAAQLGLPLIDVIHTSGIASTSQLAWRLMPIQHQMLYAAAAILAAILVIWPGRKTGER